MSPSCCNHSAISGSPSTLCQHMFFASGASEMICLHLVCNMHHSMRQAAGCRQARYDSGMKQTEWSVSMLKCTLELGNSNLQKQQKLITINLCQLTLGCLCLIKSHGSATLHLLEPEGSQRTVSAFIELGIITPSTTAKYP